MWRLNGGLHHSDGHDAKSRGRRCIFPAATAPDQPASMMPLKVVLARITLHRLSSSGWK
jgi:hypothetical protein